MAVKVDAARASTLADAVPFIDLDDVHRARLEQPAEGLKTPPPLQTWHLTQLTMPMTTEQVIALTTGRLRAESSSRHRVRMCGQLVSSGTRLQLQLPTTSAAPVNECECAARSSAAAHGDNCSS